ASRTTRATARLPKPTSRHRTRRLAGRTLPIRTHPCGVSRIRALAERMPHARADRRQHLRRIAAGAPLGHVSARGRAATRRLCRWRFPGGLRVVAAHAPCGLEDGEAAAGFALVAGE